MQKLTFLFLVFAIVFFNGCSARKTGIYTANEHYLIFEDPYFGPNCKIYVSFQTLFREFGVSSNSNDCAAAIEYIKKAETDVDVNTMRFQTEDGSPALTNLMLVNFLDSKLEYLLKNGFVLIYNTKHNEWVKKYYIRHYKTPFGGSGISVQDSNGEELYDLQIGIG